MNWRVWKAKSYSQRFAKESAEREAGALAYYDGMSEGLAQAADLVKHLTAPLEGARLGILIRAIGTAEVTEDGKHAALEAEKS